MLARCNNCGVAAVFVVAQEDLECIQDVISDFFRSESYDWNMAALVPCHQVSMSSV